MNQAARLRWWDQATTRERLRWWFTWRIWRPLRRRCSFCGNRLTNGDLIYGTPYGVAAWACASCTEYPEG